MQLFCAAACFLFTAIVSLKTSKLAYGSDSDVFDVSLLCSLTETFRGLNSCICVQTSCFLKAAVIHHFPSRVSLDACCLRYCLFPEPLLKPLKFLNSPSAQTARIFTRLSQWFFTGNNQRLNNRHLRLYELFYVGRCLALLPFRSEGEGRCGAIKK